MKQKILITGGAGFIGSHTAVDLVQAGYDIVIIDNFSNSDTTCLKGIERITGKKVPFYNTDCCNKEALQLLFREHRIDAAIHFAAFKAVGESVHEPLKYYRNNLLSFINLLDVMKENGGGSVVFSSSATVYGQADKLPVTEESPRNPANCPYGSTKQMCEDILRDTATAFPSIKGIILRYFNPIGAHPSP
jgi:UDP-glucose 4-epimerase